MVCPFRVTQVVGMGAFLENNPFRVSTHPLCVKELAPVPHGLGCGMVIGAGHHAFPRPTRAGRVGPPNVGGPVVEAIERLALGRLNVPMPNTQNPTPQTLERTYHWLQQVLQDDDNRVYVHCRAGVERTAAVLSLSPHAWTVCPMKTLWRACAKAAPVCGPCGDRNTRCVDGWTSKRVAP
jgi:rhodanese-related sulfurtransferase